MTEEDFEILLVRYGHDVSLWPEADRGAARALMAQSLTARRHVAESEALAALLAADHLPTAPSGLRDTVMAAVNQTIVAAAQTRPEISLSARILKFCRTVWPQAVSFVAASVLGVAVGVADIAPLPSTDQVYDQANDMADNPVDGSGYVLGYDGDDIIVSLNEDGE